MLDWEFKLALMRSSRELLNERRWLVKGALIDEQPVVRNL